MHNAACAAGTASPVEQAQQAQLMLSSQPMPPMHQLWHHPHWCTEPGSECYHCQSQHSCGKRSCGGDVCVLPGHAKLHCRREGYSQQLPPPPTCTPHAS